MSSLDVSVSGSGSRRVGRRVSSSVVVVPKNVTSMGVVSYGVAPVVDDADEVSNATSEESGSGVVAGAVDAPKVTKQKSRKSTDSGAVAKKVKERSSKAAAVVSASKESSKGSKTDSVKSPSGKSRAVKKPSEVVPAEVSAKVSTAKKSSSRGGAVKEVKPEVVVSAKVASKDVKPRLAESKKARSKSVSSGDATVKEVAPKRVKRPSGSGQKK